MINFLDMRKLIGREHEIAILKRALKSKRPELIAVYGRRRVGKTFLIRTVYSSYLRFEFSGIHNAPLSQQLNNFHLTLGKYEKPNSWLEAFHQLRDYLNRFTGSKKSVIFIDEFPWLDTHKSGFLAAFDNFWNSWASKKDNLIVVICGSAASYMIKNIIKSKGGLHNRLTEKIRLVPFNLFETEKLLKRNKVFLSRYDIVQVYMAMGGIPHYLERILPGESVAQLIDRLCFKKDGFLRMEFKNVFASLFNHHHNHETIIRALASVRKGLTRDELRYKSRIKSGGTLTLTLIELEQSGFIDIYLPYKVAKKSALYRLTDEYSMFYIKFIEKTKVSTSEIWIKLYGKQSYKVWSGFCFETLCIKHVKQIKEALKISGINMSFGSWVERNTDNNIQIDLLLDRDDNVINICEMKFYNTEYAISKKYAMEITNKLNVFFEKTKTRKSLYLTFITTYGLIANKYSNQIVQNELTMNDLFVDA